MIDKENNLIKLLMMAIKDEDNTLIDGRSIDWEDMYYEAEQHSIKALIYTSAKNNGLLNGIEKELLNKWKKDTILTGVSQINHIKTTAYVLDKFNKVNIPIIVLKGLVVRELYKNPEFRTMGDSDVLVHEEDLDRVRELLTSLGYSEDIESDEHGAHIVFVKPGVRKIEVHWTLINDDYFRGTKEFERNIWENAVEVSVGGTKTLSLCLEDLALHLCVHMAVHIAAGGFGLRQLCDLVLLVEKEGSNINWDVFMNNGRDCGVEKFVIAIFKCCNKLFNMEIPMELSKSTLQIDDELADLLIQDIFESGVFGKKDISKGFGAGIAYKKGNNEADENKEEKTIIRFIKFIFPKVETMSDRYNYAKNNKFLTPIAWIHHVFAGIFNKDYKLSQKIRFFTSTVKVANKRKKLLQWLELS